MPDVGAKECWTASYKQWAAVITLLGPTNRDLHAVAKEKLFREDLLARFTDYQVIPPLRERVADLEFILD